MGKECRLQYGMDEWNKLDAQEEGRWQRGFTAVPKILLALGQICIFGITLG